MGVTLRGVSVMPDPVTPGAPVEAVWGNEVVAALTAAVNTVMSLLPIGICAPYGGTNEPANWLWCRGGDYSTVTWTELYAVIGDRFASHGSGGVPAGYFRTPNMQGRSAVGVNHGSAVGMVGGSWTGGVGEVGGSINPSLPQHVHSEHIHYLNPHDHPSGNPSLSFLFRADTYNGDGNTLPWPLEPNTGVQIAWRDRTGPMDSSPFQATQPSQGGLVNTSVTPNVDAPQIPPGVSMNWIIRAK